VFDVPVVGKHELSVCVLSGSSEGHTAYLYKCTHNVEKANSKMKGGSVATASTVPCDIVAKSDPLFKEAFEVLNKSRGEGLSAWVSKNIRSEECQWPRRRQRGASLC